MRDSPAMRRKNIWHRRDLDPTHQLAAAVILMAVEDAQARDDDALSFLRGGGTSWLWFDVVTPPERDPVEVRKLVLGMVEMERAS